MTGKTKERSATPESPKSFPIGHRAQRQRAKSTCDDGVYPPRWRSARWSVDDGSESSLSETHPRREGGRRVLSVTFATADEEMAKELSGFGVGTVCSPGNRPNAVVSLCDSEESPTYAINTCEAAANAANNTHHIPFNGSHGSTNNHGGMGHNGTMQCPSLTRREIPKPPILDSSDGMNPRTSLSGTAWLKGGNMNINTNSSHGNSSILSTTSGLGLLPSLSLNSPRRTTPAVSLFSSRIGSTDGNGGTWRGTTAEGRPVPPNSSNVTYSSNSEGPCNGGMTGAAAADPHTDCRAEVKRLRQMYQEELDKSARLLGMLMHAQDRIRMYEDVMSAQPLTDAHACPSSAHGSVPNASGLPWGLLLPFFPDLEYDGRADHEILRGLVSRLAETNPRRQPTQRSRGEEVSPLHGTALDSTGFNTTRSPQESGGRAKTCSFPFQEKEEGEEKKEKEEDGWFHRVVVQPDKE